MSGVWTVGYEGAALDRWIETLQAADVQTVVDVRDLPISRRRGFSKSALSASLDAAGIEYVHIRALGNPREYRHALKAGELAFDDFAPLFRDRLNGLGEDIQRVLEMAQTKRVCLICFEEDPSTCHRSLVAQSLVAASSKPLAVEHLRHAGSA